MLFKHALLIASVLVRSKQRDHFGIWCYSKLEVITSLSSIPDNVWMIKLFKLLEQRDFTEDGHRYSVLGEREPHFLQSYDFVGRSVSGTIHSTVST